ncbi:protein-disulfide reductase DsbD domain-containing protein [Amaricoccus sp.]|uniref:protein-disulfide reductase DsbD domain-containing protein n=1 Tax=Amaricoccus sp. TaxID=1872485 RepID=UPI001B5D1D89|nr:protein-disulfide reductase DsbD domain-containing protein [Amaricoccus sp.]MBP7242763.1 hypothetical protein [Amaricoccus sp.]
MPALPTSSLLAATLLAAALGQPASAQHAALPPAVEGIELLPGWRAADGTYVAAVELRLAPGWHTYWRVPGASGMPPQFDWSGSRNLAAVAYEWPRPIVFESFGETMIGYENRLVLPVVLTPERPDAPVEARVDVQFGLCNDICAPASARLAVRLDPTAPVGRTAKTAEIERALADRPVAAAAAGVTRARCRLGTDAAGATLTAEVDFDAPPPAGVTAVIEADERPDLWIGVPETRVEGRRVRATAPVEAAGSGLTLDRRSLRVTLIDSRQAIDIRGCPSG